MTVLKSSALKSKLMGSSVADTPTGDGFTAIMDKFFIDGYPGTQPNSADDAPGWAFPLITWSIDDLGSGDEDNGGTWGDPSNVGVVQRAMTDNLIGTALAGGQLGWIRIRLAAEHGALNTADTGKVHPRLDMTIGSYGTDATIGSTTVEVGVEYPFGPLIITAI